MVKINFRGRDAFVTGEFPAKPCSDEYIAFYGIRHSETDLDEPITIEPLVMVNRWGTIGFKESLSPDLFDENQCIPIWEGEKDILREAMGLYLRRKTDQ